MLSCTGLTGNRTVSMQLETVLSTKSTVKKSRKARKKNTMKTKKAGKFVNRQSAKAYMQVIPVASPIICRILRRRLIEVSKKFFAQYNFGLTWTG
jgi:hypothetical protein